MALTFDERGLLVAGVHEATLDEVDEHFGRFQQTNQRLKLMAKLREYVAEAGKAIPGCAVIIDGSFVMLRVDEPDDIDIVLELPDGWDTDASLQARQYNLVWRSWTRKHYSIEVFPAVRGSAKFQEWVTFFAQIRREWREAFGWPDGIFKGHLRVVP